MPKQLTRREKYALKNKWLVPKEMFLHREYLDAKTKTKEIHDKPSGMEDAVRFYYRSEQSITREDVEDAYMDAVANAYTKGVDKSYNQIMGHAKTLKFRKSATNLGKNQRGETPKGGRRPYIGNHYDAEGNNTIECLSGDELFGIKINGQPSR